MCGASRVGMYMYRYTAQFVYVRLENGGFLADSR
jgi:hypothetical protein